MSTIVPISTKESHQAYDEAKQALVDEINVWKGIADTLPPEQRQRCIGLVHKLAREILDKLGKRYAEGDSGSGLRIVAQRSIDRLQESMRQAEVSGWSLQLDQTTEAVLALAPPMPLKVRDTLPESLAWNALMQGAPVLPKGPTIDSANRQASLLPQEHGPTPLTHLSDALEVVHHAIGHGAGPVVGGIMHSSVRIVQVAAVYAENVHSEHVVRDTAIDLAAELAVVGTLAARVGGGPASLVLGVSHFAQAMQRNWPGPSEEELSRQLVSPDLAERKRALDWLKSELLYDIMALPADGVHALSHAVKDVVNSSDLGLAPSGSAPSLPQPEH